MSEPQEFAMMQQIHRDMWEDAPAVKQWLEGNFRRARQKAGHSWTYEGTKIIKIRREYGEDDESYADFSVGPDDDSWNMVLVRMTAMGIRYV